MSVALLSALLLIQSVLLAAVGALAGVLWSRLRAAQPPIVEAQRPHPRRDGPSLIAVPDLSSKPRPSPEAVRPYREVWDLADSGHNAEAIAARTGTPVGQVELILGLRNRAAGVRS